MDGRETLWKRAPLVTLTDGQTIFRGDLSTTNGPHAPGDGACDGNPRRLLAFRSPRPFSDTWLSSTGPSAGAGGDGCTGACRREAHLVSSASSIESAPRICANASLTAMRDDVLFSLTFAVRNAHLRRARLAGKVTNQWRARLGSTAREDHQSCQVRLLSRTCPKS